MKNHEELLDVIQLFPRKDGTISIWDHPNFKSNIVLPDDYRPLTRTEEGLELIKRGRLNKEQMMVLKVVGDAMCANENQLRRYLSRKLTYNITSKHLRTLRKSGLVERHKCRLYFIEEDGEEVIRPPAPHTLGIGGYKLLNHYYSDAKFVSPDSWQQNSGGVQRYVAMNELRCLAVESGNLRGWTWFPNIGGSTKYRKPFAVMRVDTSMGEFQFIIERAQMSQNFIDYFRVRLEELRYLYKRDQIIRIDGHKKTSQQAIVLSVSSEDMANYIQSQLHLHTYPFDIFFIVDEWFNDVEGMGAAIGRVNKKEVKKEIDRIRMKFLQKQNE